MQPMDAIRFREVRFLAPVVILLLLATPPPGQASPTVDGVRIGVVIDGPSETNAEILALFQREITALLEGEFDARFPADKIATADWDRASVTAALERLLTDDEVDLVLAIGFMASCLATLEEDLPKPVVAPFAVSTLMRDLPMTDGVSGVRNLTYLAVPDLILRDLRAFEEVVAFERLAFLYHRPIAEAFPDASRRSKDRVREALDIDLYPVPAHDSADEALAALPPAVDAVYLTALPAMSRREMQRLAEGLIERKLPSFSMVGRRDVEAGVLVGLLPEAAFDQRARRTAIVIQRILLGEAPETLPVSIATEQRLSLNMATARAIGVSPRWVLISEADLVDEVGRESVSEWTLGGAMREAVSVNMDLVARQFATQAGRQRIREARARLLPQLEVGATGLWIDDDRAEASFGQTAEQTLLGSAGLTQLLFSEPAWANLSIQKHLQEGRELELEALRLDVARDAAVAYLNVLAAQALERIEKENLKVTRENLELAKVREQLGVAGPAEVYRWEAQIAQSRDQVIQANAQRNLAEMQLNRILHRRIEESFTLSEAGLDDPDLLLRLAPPFVYVDDRQNFRLLRRYLSELALEISPELAALDAAIAAQGRYVTSQSWQYVAPTLALQAKAENKFIEEGAGSGPSGLSGLLPPGAPPLPEADDLNWQVALSLSLPLFQGGERYATHARARAELDQLRMQREATTEKIEQQVRSALHASGASYASIRLTNEAAEAAARTLDVVKEAYAVGAVSILELLDAQNAALATEQAAAIAVYAFLADYARVQRAIGRFDVFLSEEEKQINIDRLEEYIREHGGVIRQGQEVR